MNRKKITRYGFTLVIILIPLALFFFVLFFIHHIKDAVQTSNSNNKNIHVNHILIAGTLTDKDMLHKFYEGALVSAPYYNAVVEKLQPSSMADTRDLQTWLDYASYVDADGIIIFSDDESNVIKQPVNAYGSIIPVITLGNNNPDNNQVCFIGTNKYELGKAFAGEISLFEETAGKKVRNILALVNTDKNITATDRILASMQEELQKRIPNNSILIHTEQISSRSSSKIDSAIRSTVKNGVTSYKPELILCFSADDTVITAQTLIDLNLTADTEIIGLYENEKTQIYIDIGIIFSVVSVDAKLIGMQAMENLFSWKADGYANSYSTSDIVIIRKEEKL